jgi:hypothetical protein
MAATTAGKAQAGGGGAVVIFLLAAALALGGGHTAAHTGSSSTGLTSPGDPCHGLPSGHQLDSWSTRHGTVTFDCRAWRHARDDHGAPDLQTVRDCIASILASGGRSGFSTNNGFGEPRSIWTRPFGRIIFSLADGRIISVFPRGKGGWTRCAQAR